MAINERNYMGFALSAATGSPHRIRHLPKMIEWEKAVYMYEAGDKFVADVDGIDNLPGQQLANRTEFLYEQNTLLAQACRGLVDVVKEVSLGKLPLNGYVTALSRDRPGKPCAWVEPMDGLPTVEKTFPFIEADDGETYNNPASQIEMGEGIYFYVGGDGAEFPHVLKIVGTFDVVISSANVQAGAAWIQPSENIGQATGISSDVVFDDGSRMDNPTAMIVNEADEVYYVKTYAADREPIYDEVVDINGYEVATHSDIDAIISR